MTDSQLLFGILQNDEHTWRHICREMKPGFVSIIRNIPSIGNLSNEDIDDIFQESLIVLMQKAKGGTIAFPREGALFSYLTQIGKFTASNLLRKKRLKTVSDDAVTFSSSLHNIEEADVNVDEKQQAQNDFLDRVLELLPSECKTLLKYFYWNRKPMDEIASILGMRNADSAKTKKSKCMSKSKEIAAQLIGDEEFAEEAIRNAIDRAALREIINEERLYADRGLCMAALDIDKDNDKRE